MKLTDFKSHFARPLFRRPFAQVFALAAALTLLVDSLSRESVLRALGTLFTNPLVFLYNMLIVAITLAPALFFTRRIFFTPSFRCSGLSSALLILYCCNSAPPHSPLWISQ